MYDAALFNKITLLSYVIDDIRELDEAMKATQDPSLLIEYKQEMRELVTELNEVSERVLVLVEEYMKECNDNDEPINLDYYRVYKELRRAIE